ncbi:ATP-binding cassette domain-containing protein [Alcanivorax marinus]|uniref:ATP-binding cassette domain-containing protein n=1 Tax=Alloalcanivorax marinus TaxID=1177169 RepID=A0A9Q3UIT1_9GAMM|nr:ATP-binding cassette domain-containing protein [Alloalcanivorax marinus]MCC4307971.1 ATP-binding cassette domain-containing protein [Alloalcanivorax marinus]MCU5785153.1 ABC transporter ATP-binding protein [Alloalcanivorax marinus]
MIPALDLEDLRFHHPGQPRPFIAVERLTLAPGERVLIHGPSGCGKSTLLSLVTGIRPLQRGDIHIAGEAFSGLSQRRRDAFRADHMGVIFQAFNLLPYLSALDNVALTPAFSPRRRQREAGERASAALALLRRLGLGETVARLPAHQLSFGQQQRVAAARALFGQPELIVADEPTSALDSGHRDGLMRLLADQCERGGSALLMVSHDPAVALFFHRTLAFEDINRAARHAA